MTDTIRTGPAAIKFGIFTVVTLFATAILGMTVANMQFKATHGYKAIFSDATFLHHGDDVRLAGVRVGTIGSIKLHEGTLAEVSFTVEKAVPITPNTRAEIRYRNLIGQRYLALVDTAGRGERVRPGYTIPLERTVPALNLTQLFNGFRPLLQGLTPDDVNKLSYGIIRVLQGEGGTVDALLSQTASLSSTLADRDQLIGQVINNLNAVLGPVAQREGDLTDLVVQLQRLVTGLSGDRTAIGNALVGINDLTSTTSDLLRDARPSLKVDITELGKLTKALDTPSGRHEIDKYLKELPDRLRLTGPVVAYGSWINFYLCAVNFKVGPNVTDVTAVHYNEAARCF
ncbi:MAG: phospholipid/cholesterol/gamma-HCH transport system substrate-binding protein [Frankiales bacterium]|jgi:phospholipid/cholesterol/gamma-HCH transport system substrate-binding protein|nr:phospholipid/cholesterol/gamma-HCH transport system substrate-binding protein [Frankiales bacterium]